MESAVSLAEEHLTKLLHKLHTTVERLWSFC